MDERATRIEREMLTQEVRVFVEPVGFWRRVQIVLPSEPRFFIKNDVDIASDNSGTPESTKPDTKDGWGADRTYKGPPMEGGQQIEFCLAPGQWLVGATERGSAPIAVILEWAPGPA